MIYNCNNRCRHFHFISSATITGGNLVLTFADSPTGLANTNRFCARFECGVTLPTGYQTLPVQAVINGTTVNVLNKYGNPMTGADLVLNSRGSICSRHCYKGYIGQITSGSTTTLRLIFNNAPKNTFHCC